LLVRRPRASVARLPMPWFYDRHACPRRTSGEARIHTAVTRLKH
jgi:hypothetical protein